MIKICLQFWDFEINFILFWYYLAQGFGWIRFFFTKRLFGVWFADKFKVQTEVQVTGSYCLISKESSFVCWRIIEVCKTKKNAFVKPSMVWKKKLRKECLYSDDFILESISITGNELKLRNAKQMFSFFCLFLFYTFHCLWFCLRHYF